MIEPHSLEIAPKLTLRLSRFFRWWGTELTGLAPSALKRAIGGEQDVLLFRIERHRLSVSRLQDSPPTSIAEITVDDEESPDIDEPLQALRASLGRDRHRIVLAIDASRVIRRTTTLPSAAKTDLRGALQFEIERLTPFRSDDVYFTHTVLHRNPNEKTVTVELVVTPYKFVDPYIQCLRSAGFEPAYITAATPKDSDDLERLKMPVAGITESPPAQNKSLKTALVLTVALASAAALSPLFALQSAVHAVRTESQEWQEKSRNTVSLNRETDELGKHAAIIGPIKSRASSPLAILETLSRLLPDGTWLQQCTISGREVVLDGRTRSSAELINIIEAAPLFASVKYQAPVTREPDSGIERFSFSLTLTTP